METMTRTSSFSSNNNSSCSSNIQPPWEREPFASSTTIDKTRNNYLYTLSSASFPIHIRTNSCFSSFSTPATDHSHAPVESSFSSINARRHAQSGPLPFHHGEKTLQDLFVKRMSSSGPLIPSNPYAGDYSFTHELLQSNDSDAYSEACPALKTPPPWSELRQVQTAETNPYLNISMYDLSNVSRVSTSNSPSPPTLNPSTPEEISPKVSSRKLSPSSLSRNADPDKRINGDVKHAGQLGFNRESHLFATSSMKHSTSAQTGASCSSEGTGSVSPSTIKVPADKEMNENGSLSTLPLPPNPGTRKVPIHANLNRSLTVYEPNAEMKPLSTSSRSMPFGIGTKGKIQDGSGIAYTKARSLVDKVVERLVGQLVSRQDRPNVLADMIFSTAKLSNIGVLVNPFSAARLLVERILLVQLRSLSPKLMVIASDPLKFERQKWALKGQKNGKNQEGKTNYGLRLLRLQKRFVEIGLDTFDVLCKLHRHLPDLVAEDVSTGQGLLRIACIGGGPGCSALALHLFFLRMSSCLENQVNISCADTEWSEIVDCISLKGIGCIDMELLELIRHPSLLRSYKLIAFVNSLGEEMTGKLADAVGQWQGLWNKLYQSTSAMVLIIIYETGVRWEEMMPSRGQWWCSSIRDQDSLHIVRKI